MMRLIFVLLIVISHLHSAEEIARGGGRGGGGSRGGGGRSAPARVSARSNSPSMSRVTPRQSPIRTQPATPIRNTPAVRTPTRTIPQQLPARQISPVTPARGTTPARNMAPQWNGTRASFENLQNVNRTAANRVQNQIARNRPNMGDMFNGRFFDNNNIRPAYGNLANAGWRAATWGSVAGWLGYSDYPIYYDSYGEASQLTPDVYTTQVNVQPTQTTTQAAVAPSGDWLPLGVFAAGRSEAQAGYSNMYVQLAINRQGDIAGTYYNAGTNKTSILEGSTDPETQEASWTIAGKEDSPVISTGIYNLTQDVVNVTVEFPSGVEQNWVLVRLSEPTTG